MSQIKTGEARRAAVEMFLNRGKRSARDVANELGVSQQILYNWAKRLEEGDSLDGRRPGPPPRNKAAIERASKRANIVVAKAAQAKAAQIVRRPQKEISIEIQSGPRVPTFEEWVSLRNENAMLKRMLAAAVDTSN